MRDKKQHEKVLTVDHTTGRMITLQIRYRFMKAPSSRIIDCRIKNMVNEKDILCMAGFDRLD